MSYILISGSVAYDRVMSFGGKFQDHILPDKLDHLAVSFTVDTLTEGFGGTAGNIAYSLSLLGEKPTILSTVGNDFEKYAAYLKERGIDSASIAVAGDVPTAAGFMMADAQDNQIAAFYVGAMARAYSKEIDIPKDAIAIIAAGNNEDMTGFARSYRSLGLNYLYDPGQQVIRLTPEELKEGIEGAGVLFANEYEFGVLTERTGWSKEEIASKVPTIIITLAEKGTRIIRSDTETLIAATPVRNVVDPTGAGDAYRAGYIAGLVRNLAVETCVQIASAVGAYAVECKGTQNHSFTIAELSKRYSDAYGAALAL
jgi:adenosine kinase